MTARSRVYRIILISVLLLIPLFSHATDYTSSHFISRDPIFGDFGAYTSSNNFASWTSGGQSSTGEASSTHFILRSGFLYYNSFTPRSAKWRWYNDETNETPTSALAAENSSPNNIVNANILKLRLTIKEVGGIAQQTMKLKLQFSESSNFATTTDVVSQGSCVGNSLWCYADGAGVDNVIITTKVLSDANSCAISIGTGCGTHNEFGTTTSTFNHQQNAATEYEFTIKHAGARANTTYFFRAYDVGNDVVVPLDIGASYPSLATEGATLSFTLSGLASGTVTGGLTTDVTTSATGVALGSLPFATPVAAAQRLSVTTNATEGYQIFVLQTAGLLRNGPSEITPVNGTNASPAAFAIPGGAQGAYGYHTTDSTLAGGSARFAADDTYAKFETTAREIAYSSVPVSAETTDMLYRTQVTNQQPAGTYDSSVIYIVVPVF